MTRLTPGVGRYYQTSYTPDGKIIYVSEESGNEDVWMMQADGSGARQLTVDSAKDCYPKVSADNRFIIFASNRTGAFHLWKMELDGTNVTQLTDGDGETYPDVSPDGKFIVYMALISGSWQLSKISIEGANPTQILNHSSRFGNVSPDGKWIVCLFPDRQTNSKWQAGIVSIADGKILKVLDIPTEIQWQLIQWTPDGQALTYIDVQSGLYNLWNYPLNGGSPKQLTHFNSSDQILFFDWSADGKNLICLRGLKTNDAIYLTHGSDLNH